MRLVHGASSSHLGVDAEGAHRRAAGNGVQDFAALHEHEVAALSAGNHPVHLACIVLYRVG